jgi:hypothetical protein
MWGRSKGIFGTPAAHVHTTQPTTAHNNNILTHSFTDSRAGVLVRGGGSRTRGASSIQGHPPSIPSIQRNTTTASAAAASTARGPPSARCGSSSSTRRSSSRRCAATACFGSRDLTDDHWQRGFGGKGLPPPAWHGCCVRHGPTDPPVPGHTCPSSHQPQPTTPQPRPNRWTSCSGSRTPTFGR